MNSPFADHFTPLSIIFICTTALAAVGQLGPDKFSTKASPSQISKAKTVTTKPPITTKPASDRTLPKISWKPQPPATEPLTKIGFGSCLRQNQSAPIWQSIIDAKPQTFLMLGDNVYGDFNTSSGAALIRAYNTLANHADFTKARNAIPMLATWDDHDYGRNDGGADHEHKDTATKLFRQFWDGSGSLAGNRGPGIAYAHTFGPVGKRLQIVFLDTRSFRSKLRRKPKGTPGKGKYQPDPSAEKTLLGDAQWQWLEARLNEPAELRLIVSSIQVLAEGHRWERWGNLPKERKKLFRLLDGTQSHRTIFLSGDRHRAAYYRMNRKGRPPFVEVTSSALNSSFPDPTEKGTHQLTPMLGKNNFGMVTIDWNAQIVTLTLRTENGVAASVLAIPFAGLG